MAKALQDHNNNDGSVLMTANTCPSSASLLVTPTAGVEIKTKALITALSLAGVAQNRTHWLTHIEGERRDCVGANPTPQKLRIPGSLWFLRSLLPCASPDVIVQQCVGSLSYRANWTVRLLFSGHCHPPCTVDIAWVNLLISAEAIKSFTGVSRDHFAIPIYIQS